MSLVSNMDSPESVSILKQGRIYVSCLFFYPLALPPPPNEHAVHKCQEQDRVSWGVQKTVWRIYGERPSSKGLLGFSYLTETGPNYAVFSLEHPAT